MNVGGTFTPASRSAMSGRVYTSEAHRAKYCCVIASIVRLS